MSVLRKSVRPDSVAKRSRRFNGHASEKLIRRCRTCWIFDVMSSASMDIRSGLADALRLDLVGPSNSHAFAKELLREPPSRWYLTGYLVPADAPQEQKVDPTADDELDEGGDAEGVDDASPPDRAGSRKSL